MIVVQYRDEHGQWAYPGNPDACEARDMAEAVQMIEELRILGWDCELRILDDDEAVEPALSETIGGRVAARRARGGLTQEEAGKLAGLRKQHWSRLERGGMPSVETLVAVAEALGCSVGELVD